MNFVKEYYEFKQKWYLKIGGILLDLYICKENNNKLNKIKYEFLNELINYHIYNQENDTRYKEVFKNVTSVSLNRLEYDLLKEVVNVSNKFPNIAFKESDYVYYTMLLEIIITIYNTCFSELNSNVINGILKENLFRFKYIDFRKNQSKFNLLMRYVNYINKNLVYYFGNLKNKNVQINLNLLSNHSGYYVIDIENKLARLAKIDEEIVTSVEKTYNYLDKLFELNIDLVVQSLIYLLEKRTAKVNRIIFNIDNYKYKRELINYLNKYDSIITGYIMISSKDKKKLDLISNKYDKCIYLGDAKNKKINTYTDYNVLVTSSFWKNKRKTSNISEDIKIITINDNISYKFEREVI